mmetsp:Transcript_77154/g.249733  ORF Transcript_77154/g.249733 Transcript_77154/m.249733 type:complete len:159 (-) Transcript_77154:105-581(-)
MVLPDHDPQSRIWQGHGAGMYSVLKEEPSRMPAPGQAVRLVGLTGRPELNGQEGHVLLCPADPLGRIRVRLTGDGTRAEPRDYRVTPTNLRRLIKQPAAEGSRPALSASAPSLPSVFRSAGGTKTPSSVCMGPDQDFLQKVARGGRFARSENGRFFTS